MTTPNGRDTERFVVPGLVKLLTQRRSSQPVATAAGHGASGQATASPWLTVKEAAARARCGLKLIYREVKAERLQAAKVGGRRELRFRAEWIDDWLMTHRVIK